MKKTVIAYVRIDEELDRKLSEEAEREERTKSSMINVILKNYYKGDSKNDY